MYIPYISLVMFLVIARQFFRRFRRERKRQEAFTWPEVRVQLPEAPLDLSEQSLPFKAVLAAHFHFFYRGEKTAGDVLIQNEPQLSTEQRKLVLGKLEKQRDSLSVRFNPEKPTESALRIGYEELSWGRTLFYIFVGVVLPALLFFSYASWHRAPAGFQEAIQLISN